MALTLLAVVALAAVIGGVLLTAHATDTSTTATDTTQNTAIVAADSNSSYAPGGCFGGIGFEEHGFGRGARGGGPMGAFGGSGAIEVSTEFTQKVTDIANNDTDVQNLIAQGYNITAIRPIIKSVVDADGYVTTQATSAIVMLQNGTSGFARVTVNIEEAKVTEIVILTRTVIQK